MIYKTIFKSDFRNEFIACGREDQFSYEGLGALYDYMDEISENCPDVKWELDVVALCCEYTEDTIENTLAYYDLESLEQLQDKTIVIWHDDENVLYQNY